MPGQKDHFRLHCGFDLLKAIKVNGGIPSREIISPRISVKNGVGYTDKGAPNGG
jgi:hypothetical protein